MNTDNRAGPGRSEIVAALAEFPVRAVELGARRAAAVAVAVCESDSGNSILLTMRSSGMRAHPGQFALPGGSIDDGETAEQAAIREMHEELGIAASEADVLGRLDDYPTRSGYVITPVVLWLGDRKVDTVPNTAEVSETFFPTFDEVDTDPRFVEIPESDRPVVQWPFRGYLVHAPTGAIVYQFREVVLNRRRTRVDQLEQPVFAWR